MKNTETLPRANHIEIDQQTVTICAFDTNESRENLADQAVQIIASGPSITDLAFAALKDRATIFSTVVSACWLSIPLITSQVM